MQPGEYAEHYRRFTTYTRNFGTAPFLIACGPNRNNKEWTQKFMEGSNRRRPNGYAMHFYSNSRLPATKFTVDAMRQQFDSFSVLEQSIVEQRALLDTFDPHRQVGLMVDEWGVWDQMVPEEQRAYGRLWQQITVRCAVAAALGLNIFHRHAEKLVMCNIAQIVNVLHSVILAHEDKCIRTPTYYAFELLKPHRAKTAVKVEGDDAVLSASASRQENEVVLTLVNTRHDAPMNVQCSMVGKTVTAASARSLYHADINACNTFEAPDVVVPKNHSATASGSNIRVELPPLSVTTVTARLG
jgi:alpha-N-arabinofuranosidase